MLHSRIALGILVAGSLAQSSAAYADPARFDLICSGTSSFGSLAKLTEPRIETQFSLRYRVDLTTRKWCSGDCISSSDLAEVTDRVIVFERHEDKDGDEVALVNRESAHYTYRLRSWIFESVTLNEGSCEPAPFSGLPVRKF